MNCTEIAKKKANFRILQLLIMGLFIILASSCEKDDNNNPIPVKIAPVFNPAVTYGTMTDQEGNVYKTVKIGKQTWMAENLRTTKYRDGSNITLATNRSAWFWDDITTGIYCNYYNTLDKDSIATFGRLYNWYAVTDARNIAPAGWHVPTNAEWTELANYLGGRSVAGNKLKEAGTTHWYWNIGATNESGFTAVPSGYRYVGAFGSLGDVSRYWCAEGFNGLAYCCYMFYNNSEVSIFDTTNRTSGYSVRCVKN